MILLNLSGFAQQSEYKVFYFSGSPKIQQGKKEIPITRDAFIAKDGVLNLPANSYIVLTNGKEIPMGINKPGNYSITDLNKIYENVGNNNLTQEFFDYIANNMIRNDEKARRSGGVYRAVGDILISPFDEAMIIDNKLTFEWKNPKQKKLYLKVYNTENWEQIYNMPITDSTYTLVFDESKLSKSKQYAWTIYHSQEDPEQGTILRVFTFADDKWCKEINNKIEAIASDKNNAEFNKVKIIRLKIDNNVYPYE